ncbi:MAG TPA: hypothetical protein VHV81_13510 [Steroidobacteraceae bacterium]|jgi:ElaB/YqjD/DUF883 family membrane-anchored ribosome-binding protein|nr:hypothetical protein [Steroidobacteraceae bacterium]
MKTNARLNELVADVEELLGELKEEHGPEINELRVQVENAVAAVRRAIRRNGSSAAGRVGRYARTADAYINEYPRLAFATGAVVAGGIGYLVGLAASGRGD